MKGLKWKKSLVAWLLTFSMIFSNMMTVGVKAADVKNVPAGNLVYGITPTFGNFEGTLSTDRFQQKDRIKHLTSGTLNSDNWVSTPEELHGPAYMQVDLGDAQKVNQIKTWQYYKDNRRNFWMAVQVSVDGEEWTTMYNNDAEDKGGLKALGTNPAGGYDEMVTESVDGHDISFEVRDVRYIRFWSGGYYVNNNSLKGDQPLWVQLQAFNACEVAFDPNYEGAEIISYKVPSGATVNRPENPVYPEKGYVFNAWMNGDKAYDFSAPVTESMTLTADWKEVGICTVTFNYNDGQTESEKVEVTKGDVLTMPENPAREGYNFAGWKLNGVPFDARQAITEDITLDACWVSAQTADEVEINAGQVDFYLNNQGQITNIVSKVDGQDYVPEGHQDAYLISLIANRGQHLPTALSFDSKNGMMSFEFASINTQVDVKVEEKGDYTTFTVDKVEAPANVDMETLLWGPIKLTISDVVGESLGVAYNQEFGIGIHDLNDKTIGGWPQEWANLTYPPGYTHQDNTYLSGMTWQAQAAVVAPTWNGSFLQSYTNDYTHPTVRMVAGHPWVKNDKVDQMDFSFNSFNAIAEEVVPSLVNSKFPEDAYIEGSSIALFGTKGRNILNTVESIELTEGLPHPTTKDGEWQKTASPVLGSYINTGNLNTGNMERVAKAAAEAGIYDVYNITGAVGPFDSNGSFRFNSAWGHSDQNAKEQMGDVAKKYGVRLGTHTMSDYLANGGGNDPLYLTDYGANEDLAEANVTVLTRPVSENDTTIYIADGTNFGTIIQDVSARYMRIGSEIIQYQDLQKLNDGEWKISGCTRGARGTGKYVKAYEEGASVARLWISVYSAFLGGENLLVDVATRLAQAYNNSGVQHMSCDGLEDANKTGYMQLSVNRFASTLYNNLNDLDGFYFVNSTMNANQWDMLSREDWNRTVVENLPKFNKSAPSDQADPVTDSRAEMMHRNLFPLMYNIRNGSVQQTNRELSLIAALDAGFITGDVSGLSTEHRAYIRAWRDAMLNQAFSEQQKQDFLNAYNENGNNSWTLTTVKENQEWLLQKTDGSGAAIGDPVTVYAGGKLNVKDSKHGDVAVSVSAEDVTGINPEYDNNIRSRFAGNVSSAAHPGEKVVISPQAHDGYVLESLSVMDEKGQAIQAEKTEEYQNYVITMPASGDVTISAVFSREETHNVKTDANVKNGTVKAEFEKASKGQTVGIVAEPEAGYVLDTVEAKDAAGQVLAVNGSGQFEMPAGDVTVSATFVEAASHKIAVDDKVSGGTIKVESDAAKVGDTVKVTAVAESGYKFAQVNVMCGDTVVVANADSEATFVMPDSDVTVTAIFVPVYSVSAADGISGGTVKVDTATAAAGKDVVFTCKADAGKKIVPGSIIVKDENGKGIPTRVTGKQSKYQFTMPDSKVTITAKFEDAAARTVAVSADEAKGTVKVSTDSAKVNDEVSFTVTPKKGYAVSAVYVLDKSGNQPSKMKKNDAFQPNSNLIAELSHDEINCQFAMPDGDVTVTAYFTELSETVDKSALQSLYDENKDTVNDNFTDESWNAFQDALAKAKDVLDNAEATQEEVDAAADALAKAAEGLTEKEEPVKPADKSILQATYDYALTLTTDGVVDSAVKFFEEAKAEAKAVLDNAEATQEEVNAAIDKLLEGIWGLGLVQGDKTNLKLLIDRAEAMMAEKDRYVQKNWQQLVDALEAAKVVMEDGDALEGDVQTAVEDLLNAILAQRYKANKDNLQNILDKAEGLDLSKYTKESVAVLKEAMKNAKAVMKDDSLSTDDQKVVDKAAKDLADAMEGLKLASGDEDNNNGNDNNGNGNNGNNGASGDKDTGKDAPTTGDSASMALWLMLLCVAIVAAGTVVKCKRRK